ncbi:MAG: hypothetical protein E7613_00255 [Ruminococcaceae bacterium]|nr:hypothetical protein [Oscillospiraceae bacterium]
MKRKMSKTIDIKQTAELLSSLDNVHIYTHIHPDGDAMGSAFGLAAILKKTGKRVKVLCLDTLPRYLSYIWNTDNADIKCDNIITVDVADMSLLGDFDRTKKIILAIDHHNQNKVECENLLCMNHMAATGEIVFELAKEMDVPFDRYIAECLYTAIATDTGCFKFSNTTEHTFSSVAQLTRYVPGGNFGYLNLPLFIAKPINKMQFESDIVANLKFAFGGKVSFSVVSKEIIARHGLTDSDTGGVEQIGKSPEGVELAITLKERDDGIKVSMRSSDNLDCSVICAAFGGGGHHSAAGCFFEDTPENIINTLTAYIKEKGIL